MTTNISENKVNIKSSREKSSVHSLDTIQVTSYSSITESQISQYYKAIRKDATDRKLVKIRQVIDNLKYEDSEIWLKRFERTNKCLSIVIQDGDKLIQGRCHQARLCQNCARAESSQRIEDFKTSLLKMSQKNGLYFVTLTAPTCRERHLKSTIERRYKAFAKVKQQAQRKHGLKLNGLRKLEVTYNAEKDKYHPHFHFVIQGESEAYLLRDLWLREMSDASIKGQDIKEIKLSKDDTSNLVEVFKYATKGVVNNNTEAHAEYHILRAINKKRIFQTFGDLEKIVITQLEEKETQKQDWSVPKREIFAFENRCKDWTDSTGNRLVNLATYQIKSYEKEKDSKIRHKTANQSVNRREKKNRKISDRERTFD